MHIQKRQDTYRITVSCGRDESGKQILCTTTFVPPKGLTEKQEKKALYEFADKYERKIKGGASANYSKMTFKAFCLDYYYKNHLETLKPKTANGYRAVIESRLIPYFGNMRIKNITPLDVRGWMASLERKDGQDKVLSRNSTGSWFRTLSAILGKAYEWEIIDENPCKRVKSPTNTQPDVEALQLSEVQTICDKLPEYDDIRARTFIMLILNTGIREAEAAGLEWRDIDFDDGVISIRRTSQYIPGRGMVESTPKSKTSVRDIPISQDMVNELVKYKIWQRKVIKDLGSVYEGNPGEEARLFTSWNGKPIFDSTLRKWLTKFLKWCDLPRVTVHGLRHTFASLLIANGTDARTTAALLGHSSPALVMNVYANPQDEAKARAVDSLSGLIKRRKKR